MARPRKNNDREIKTGVTSGQPGSTNALAVEPGAGENPVVSDPVQQYIASSPNLTYWRGDRSLPETIDDAEKIFGTGIYDRMANDAMLGSAEMALKMLTLNDGVTVVPSHSQPLAGKGTDTENNDFQQAQAVADFVDYCFNRLSEIDRPLVRTLYNLLQAIRSGHKLAEITYDFIEAGQYKGKYGIASIRPKPKENYAFVVDQFNEFRGVIAKIPGGSQSIWRGIVPDVSQLENAIAPEKLIIFSIFDNDGDPRGVSLFRKAYTPWYNKQRVEPEMLNTAVQFGGGMVIGFEPPSRDQDVIDPVSGKKVKPNQAMNSSIMRMRNGATAVFPYESKIDVIQPSANPQFFQYFCDKCDKEMVIAILLAARTLLEAKHSSRADGDNSRDLLDDVVLYLRNELASAIREQLVKPLVRMNFPADIADKYMPTVSMTKNSSPDVAPMMSAFAALKSANWPFTQNQLDFVNTETFGLPQPEGSPVGAPEDDAAEMAARFRRYRSRIAHGANERAASKVSGT